MSQLSCRDTPHTPRPQPSPSQTGLRVTGNRYPCPFTPTCPRFKGSEDLLLGVQMCSLLPQPPSGTSEGDPPPFTPFSPSDVPSGLSRPAQMYPRPEEKESLLSKRNHPTSNQASRNVTATDTGESCRLGPPELSPTCLRRRAPLCRRLLRPPLRVPLAPGTLQRQHLQRRWATSEPGHL